MSHLLGILTIALICYYFRTKTSKERQAQIEADENDAFLRGAKKYGTVLATALQAIRRAGKYDASALTIRVKSLDSTFALLDMSFTVYGVPTYPFIDMVNSSGITFGIIQPEFVDVNPVIITAESNREETQKEGRRVSEQVLDQCEKAIAQYLFDSEKNYFEPHRLSAFDCSVTGKPHGDVTISWPVAALCAESYKRHFKQIADHLRERFPNASIRQTEQQITVDFG